MDVSWRSCSVKSLSSSLLSATFFPVMPPLTSASLLAAPFSTYAPCKEEEDSWTTLCPTGGVAWTVLHIINLGTTAGRSARRRPLAQQAKDCEAPRHAYWPATVAEDQEEHAEDDAGDSDMSADNDACGGGFGLLVFAAVAGGVQHWGGTAKLAWGVTPPHKPRYGSWDNHQILPLPLVAKQSAR